MWPSSVDLIFLNYYKKPSGFNVNPIQSPSTRTFIIFGMLELLISLLKIMKSNFTIRWYNAYFSIFCKSFDTDVISAKFLTIPILAPSGVSAGQINPKWVLWSYLGLDIFIWAFIGAFILLRWLKVANKDVSLFKVYATPVFTTYPSLFLPQLPVAKAFSISFVIISESKKLLISSVPFISSTLACWFLLLNPPFMYLSKFL